MGVGEMNFFGFSSILIVLFTTLMAIFMLIKSEGRKASNIWGIFCLSAGLWGFGAYKVSVSASKDAAFFWWQIGYIGVILAPVLFSHFVFEYVKLKNKYFFGIAYALAGVFLLVNLFARRYFLGDLSFMFNQVYYVDWMVYKNPLWIIFYVLFYWILISVAFFVLMKHFVVSSGLRRQQMKYFLLGMGVGWLGPHGQYIAYFRFDVYPYSNILIAIYPVIIGYAMARYRLMDITLVITRTGIFVAVYSLVLGIPFALAFGWRENLQNFLGEGWWLAPLISSTVLATAGPFIYLFIQKRAEARLFQEQKRYQSTLRQASTGMGRIKDLNRLVNLIVHIVSRTVRLEHTSVYLFDQQIQKYVLKAQRSKAARFKIQDSIETNSELANVLRRERNPIVYEEIKQKTEDLGDLKLARLEAEMGSLNVELIVPCYIDDKLLAMITLGKKSSKDIYSESDLAVFSILANQAALAMENAMFYEEMKHTHAQLMKAEKMATIGTMADGLSHQINNRLHALGFIAGDALDTIKLKNEVFMKDPEVKEIMVDLEHALNRIEDNVTQGGEIVRGLLKYTRKGEEGFSELEFDQLITAAVEMTQFKIKPGELQILREYGNNLPKIKGNFTQLQEVFFNLIDNAYDAMMQRKTELKEKGYSPTIKIFAQGDNNGGINIRFEDNGIGIEEEDKSKLFTPFFTTKLSSKKGTGLGLYVIQKLIEENHEGKVKYSSVYQQGTNVSIYLHSA